MPWFHSVFDVVFLTLVFIKIKSFYMLPLMKLLLIIYQYGV